MENKNWIIPAVALFDFSLNEHVFAYRSGDDSHRSEGGSHRSEE